MNRLRELQAPLRHRDFRLVWNAQLLSELGDWAARLALSVMVFQRTGSAALTGLVVAVSILPWFGAGQVLATLGDRFPRRRVMIVTDLVRAALFLIMAVPVPVWVLLPLGFAAALATPPFEAARSALLPKLVPKDTYADGIALASLTMQATILVGYLGGGGLITIFGARGALVVNALSFAASAAVLARLNEGAEAAITTSRAARVRDGAVAVFGDALVRRAVLSTSLLAGCAMVGESLVAVYAVAELGAGSATAGLLAATVPLGTIVASAVVPCRGDQRRLLQLSAILGAAGAMIAVAGFTAPPSTVAAALAFVGVGIVFAAALPANAVWGVRIQDEVRASAFGVLQGILMGAQGLGAAAGGVLAGWIGVRQACMLALAMAAIAGAVAFIRPPKETPARDAPRLDLRDANDGVPVVGMEPVLV